MINLQENKSLFVKFAKDSFSSLAGSSEKAEILKYDGNAAWGNLHSFYNKSFKENESYKKLVSLFSSDDQLVTMYGKDSVQRYIPYRFIDNMIILGRESGLAWLKFNQEVFDEVFTSLVKELYEPEWTYAALCPDLSFFRSDIVSIDLGEGVEIKGRTDEIKEFMAWDMEQIRHFWHKVVEMGWTSSFVLMITEKIKKEPDNLMLSNPIDALAKKENLLTCLRLFRAGNIAADIQYYRRHSKFFVMWGLMSSGISIRRMVGHEYTLNSDDIERFKRFRTEIMTFLASDIKDNKNIELALRYFNSTYAPMLMLDDKLLDCITALEALFHIDQELAFKLSFRVAYLLATSNEEQTKIFTEMKNFYSARNNIVHGSQLKEKDHEALRNIENLIDYVRRCLNAFINLAKQQPRILTNEFYEHLDIKLIDENEREKIQKSSRILNS